MQVKDTRKDRAGTIRLAVACFLLHVMLSPHVALGLGRMNFALVYAGVVALSYGGRLAVLAGFVAGLLFDLLSTGPVGLMAGLLTVFSYVLGNEERNRFGDGFVSSLSSFGTGAFLVTLVYHLAMLLTEQSSGVVDLVLLRALPTFAVTFVAFLPFAFLQENRASGGHARRKAGKGQGLRESRYDVRGL